jgi:hypothetical protein
MILSEIILSITGMQWSTSSGTAYNHTTPGQAHPGLGRLSPIERQIPHTAAPSLWVGCSYNKKTIEESEPMRLLACNIPIPSSPKKFAKGMQKLPKPQVILSVILYRA